MRLLTIAASLAIGLAAAALAAGAAAAESSACRDAIQGEIAWDRDGRNTRWAESNIDKLCAGAESSTEPGRCFEHAMTGLDWGRGGWDWEDAIALCRGTRNAKTTVICFEDQRNAGRDWEDAVERCGNDTARVARRPAVDLEPDPPAREARRVEPDEPPTRPARRVEPDEPATPEVPARRIERQDAGDRIVVSDAVTDPDTMSDALLEQLAKGDGDDSEQPGDAVDWAEYSERGWGYIKASSGLCLTVNVFDQPGSSRAKKVLKKMFDPREHAKALVGAAAGGLVFGPGGPELINSVQALRQAKKLSEGWQKGELKHSTGMTLLECGAVDEKFQAFRREDRHFVVASGHCVHAKQGQARDNGGRVQLGNCARHPRAAWYLNGRELKNGRGKCLDVHAPDLDKEGARIQLWSCNGAPQQRWTFTAAE